TQIDATTKEIKWHEDLGNYQAQVHEAQQTIAKRLDEKTQSAEREAYLRQVEQVQSVRTPVDLHRDAINDLTLRKQTREKVSNEQQLLAQQLNDADTAVTEATQYLEAQTSAQEAAKPQLAEATRL